MKNIIGMFENNNGLDLLLRGNKTITESTNILSFENSDDALDSLYEIYNESVNTFIEYKSAIYLENLVVNHMLYEKFNKEKADKLITESTEVKVNQMNENLNRTIKNVQTWITTLENSTKENDDWDHCIETSKRLEEFINNGCETEESLLKIIKESLIDYKGIPWNKSVDSATNIIEKGDKIMKNERVSKMIATKEATLNELKVIAESAELVNEVNKMQQSITDLKVKIFDNGGEMTQESYEMLMDLDVLEEGLKEKIKAAGDKRIDKKIAKKEAQIEKIKARMAKEKEDFPGELKEYEDDLKACEEKGDEKGAAKIRKRMEKMKDNHAFDIEEMEEDIKIIEGEIEKLRGKKGAKAEEVVSESYISLVFNDEESYIEESYVEEGLKDKIAGIKDKRVAKKIAKKEAQIEKLRARIEKNGEDDPDNEELREDIEIIKGEIEKLKEKIKKDGGECTQEAYAMLESLDVLEEGLREKFAAKLSGVKDKRASKKIGKKVIQIEKIKAKMEKEKEEHEANMAEYREDLKACEEKGDEKGAAKIRKRMEKDEEGFKFYMEEMEEDIKIIEGEIEKLRGKVKEAGGEMTQEAYAILESLDVLEEGLKEKMAARMSGIKDKRVAKKIAKKEAQIAKIKARMEKEKADHPEELKEYEDDLKACEEKGDEKGAAKIRKRIDFLKNDHENYMQDMEDDIEALERDIAKLKEKVKEADGEMTQEAYEILMDLDVLEEGLKAKVKAIGDKRLNKKLAKRENLLGKMKQMLLDVEDEGHKEKIQSDILDLESDIEKIKGKLEKNIDEVVQESYLEVVFEHNEYDMIDEYDYLDEGLREKIRGMKDDHLVKKVNKKEAKLAEKKIQLGEMETPEDDKKKAKIEKEIEKLEKEIERLKGKIKSEPGDNIVEGEGTQESTKIDNEELSLEAYEIEMLETQLEEMEAKIEAKQQVLNESYSYRTEVELEVLEEGLKEVKDKLEGVREKLSDKCYNWVAKRYTSQTRIEYHLDELKATIEDAENLLKSREGESKGAKAKRLAGNIITLLVCPPLLTVLRQSATVLSSEKNLRTTIKYANMEMAAFRKRLNELNSQGKSEEEAPAQEMFSVEEAAELSIMFDALIEQEEKIEAKQQVLNENYSYRNDVEVEILEEGLKDLNIKIDNKINDAILKYKKPEALRKIIEREQEFIDEAKACLEERDQEKGAKKFFKVVGRSVVYGMIGSALTPRVSLGANPAKVIRKYIASAERFIAAANRRLAKLEGESKQEEAPAQESTNYVESFKKELDNIDFED